MNFILLILSLISWAWAETVGVLEIDTEMVDTDTIQFTVTVSHVTHRLPPVFGWGLALEPP